MLWDFFIMAVLGYIKDVIINNFGRIKVPVRLINNLVFIKVIIIRKKRLSR